MPSESFQQLPPLELENMETESSAEKLIQRYKLLAGETITLRKLKIDQATGSDVAVGAKLEGILTDDVSIGKKIVCENGNRTTAVDNVVFRNGKVLIGTQTSVYELILGLNREGKEYDIDDIQEVVTAKGSRYTYLPDGTTQRYKTVEHLQCEPQQLLVYIPDYQYAQAKGWDHITNKFDDEFSYNQFILSAIRWNAVNGNQTYIVDAGVEPIAFLETNEQVRAAIHPTFICMSKNEQNNLAIPISSKPLIGFNTYDQRRFTDEAGQPRTEKHFGNAVVEIVLKDKGDGTSNH